MDLSTPESDAIHDSLTRKFENWYDGSSSNTIITIQSSQVTTLLITESSRFFRRAFIHNNIHHHQKHEEMDGSRSSNRCSSTGWLEQINDFLSSHSFSPDSHNKDVGNQSFFFIGYFDVGWLLFKKFTNTNEQYRQKQEYGLTLKITEFFAVTFFVVDTSFLFHHHHNNKCAFILASVPGRCCC
jgi:hypothetical protein